MSKMDGLRAMREARHAEMVARSNATKGTTDAAKAPVAPQVKSATAGRTKAAPTTPVSPETATDALCGHRNMSGRTCTREQGHAAKSHRYS